ncbi:carboxylesterase from carbohydrate esterase [Ophiostoma piceae UAMH 11346]|uniref:Carboxylesterase from carbohydrate esterase n=1 Tax=Ophiostoma piceae (strain UAMH 11346) TaxID=1262450 RepID=S3C1A7_OPHP1|nr:carboxylesterase from carbohydrate esterase [Ophiostoma piceae UAMH 11346]
MAIATDGEFTCYSLTKSYSAAKHNTYTKLWCTPAKTKSRPYNDSGAKYCKCHAGEHTVVFAAEARDGLPDRDGFNISFMQLVVDY